MKPLKQFAQKWLLGLRWREFGAILSAAYLGGQQLGQYVHADPAKQQQVGLVLGLVAAGCYIRNPKYAEWVEALPTSTPVGGIKEVDIDAFSTADGGHEDV